MIKDTSTQRFHIDKKKWHKLILIKQNLKNIKKEHKILKKRFLTMLADIDTL